VIDTPLDKPMGDKPADEGVGETFSKSLSLYQLAKQATISHITPANCLSVWQVTSLLPACKDLEAAAMEAVLTNFYEIARCESFLRIRKCQLQELLADQRLVSPNEEFVYETVMLWLGAQRSMPMFADVDKLMALIQYPLLQPEFVQEHVRTNPFFKDECAREALLDSFVNSGSLSRKLGARRGVNENTYRSGVYSFTHTFVDVSTLNKGDVRNSPSFMFGSSSWYEILGIYHTSYFIASLSNLQLLPHCVRGRFVKLEIKINEKNEEALALFLCADGGRVTAWDCSDKSIKVDFGFKLTKIQETPTPSTALQSWHLGMAFSSTSGRFGRDSKSTGWDNIISMEKLKSSLVSDKLVVEAWLNATRYEGGKKRMRLS
jgi:hypothetical protein